MGFISTKCALFSKGCILFGCARNTWHFLIYLFIYLFYFLFVFIYLFIYLFFGVGGGGVVH